MTVPPSRPWARTPFTDLIGSDLPIVQGPFGGGLSTPELAAAASELGGLGSFGAHNMQPPAVAGVVREIRALTSRPFAVNLWVSTRDAEDDWMTEERFEQHLAPLRPWFEELGVPLPELPESFGVDFEEQVEALIEAAPPVISFIFGVPDAGILEDCRKRGITTIGTATTADEAVALEAAGVDTVVATGLEAGGHRPSFLRSAEESLTGTLALVPAVVDRVGVPVIAAGGIADGRGVAAALVLGASAVQVGTAFLACDESGATPAHRQLLHGPAARRTVLTRSFSGRLARGMPNRLSEELAAGGVDPAPYPFQGWLLGHLRERVVGQGRTDLISLWAGQAAPLLRHRSAAEVMAALVEGTDEALGRLSGSRT